MFSFLRTLLWRRAGATAPPPSLHNGPDTNTAVYPSSRIVIVGCGCFGISTAQHLLKRGYKSVTILDRASELPAADAASTDINKIVRSSYDDEFYTVLAREAIDEWRKDEVWGDAYRESGVLVFGSGPAMFEDRSYLNDVKNGAKVLKVTPTPNDSAPGGEAEGRDRLKLSASQGTSTSTATTAPQLFNSDIPLGDIVTKSHGYLNVDGGWVNSKKGVEIVMQEVRNLGGQIHGGKEVLELLKTGTRTRGVRCADGSDFEADIVILATGSWTASAFPELKLGERCHATGQSIAMFQLTPEEATRYREMPVVLDFGVTGFYCFPPTDDGLFKFAYHYGGFANFVAVKNAPDLDVAKERISTPRTCLSHGNDGYKIPSSDARLLRELIAKVFPELAAKPFAHTRLCWYTDSPDSDWIIDVHPNDPGLALVTAGSGHGFKFLPVIGRLVADRLEGKMDAALCKKFAVDRTFQVDDSYRHGAVIGVLDDSALCGPEL